MSTSEFYNMYPSKFYISSGKGEDDYNVLSFDKALMDAGLANYNLVKVNGILPSYCIRNCTIDLREGSPLLVAYADITSSNYGDLIATAIGIGIPKDKANVGMIVGISGHMTALCCKDTIQDMVEQAMRSRSIELEDILVSTKFAEVHSKPISLISAVAMW